jgi:cold shock CspA family protein
MITGKVHSIPNKDGRPAPFAFVRGDDGRDYFLHTSELFDTWEELKWVIANKGEAVISFEATESPKGMRAVGAAIVNKDKANKE